MGAPVGSGEVRRSFLKKRTKKLFDLCSAAQERPQPKGQKFFASFFQKRSACLKN
jgi:hypothetical protein